MNASWGKLVEALEDAGETTAAGRVKEINIGIPASDALPHSAFVPRSLGGEPLYDSVLCSVFVV